MNFLNNTTAKICTIEMITEIILNKNKGYFGIREDLVDEYNRRNGTSFHSFSEELRFIPEFIESIKNNEYIGIDSTLVVELMSTKAYKLGAYEIQEYLGTENVIIHWDMIKAQEFKEHKITQKKFTLC